jgi:hypothetical protein
MVDKWTMQTALCELEIMAIKETIDATASAAVSSVALVGLDARSVSGRNLDPCC